ncbi:hypothetical protein BKA64DRAFT_751456, partial [Cadophora sp. MPI-SDFR-AT-0126]
FFKCPLVDLLRSYHSESHQRVVTRPKQDYCRSPFTHTRSPRSLQYLIHETVVPRRQQLFMLFLPSRHSTTPGQSTKMSTTGADGGGSMAGTQAGAIKLIGNTKTEIDRVLTLLEDGNSYFSQGEIVRALPADSQARTLTQSLQEASRGLGHLLHYIRHGSRSEDVPSSDLQSTTGEHVAEPENGQAGIGSEPQPERETVPEPALAEIESGGPSTVAAESPMNCTICFDRISTLCILQPCDHKFDMDCLMPWLVSVYTESHDESTLRCPLCRQVIDTIRHSIIGDGTATMMVVGPHFRQQFRRHEIRSPREDLSQPFNDNSLFHLADGREERFPGNGTVASYLPNGPLTDELRRRRRAQLFLNPPQNDVQPRFVRADHVADEAFERMSMQDILDMIDRRERLNAAREMELEAMGESASTDLHFEWIPLSNYDRERYGTAATGSAARPFESSSSLRATVSPDRDTASMLERQGLSQDLPPGTRPSAGASDDITISRDALARLIYAVADAAIRTELDERQRA